METHHSEFLRRTITTESNIQTNNLISNITQQTSPKIEIRNDNLINNNKIDEEMDSNIFEGILNNFINKFILCWFRQEIT